MTLLTATLLHASLAAAQAPAGEPPLIALPALTIRSSDVVKEPSAEERAAFEADEALDKSYLRRLKRLIERELAYPCVFADGRCRYERAEPVVELSLDRQGNLLEARLLKSSGREAYDEAARKAIRRAAPYPPPTGEIRREPVTIRARFSFVGERGER